MGRKVWYQSPASLENAHFRDSFGVDWRVGQAQSARERSARARKENVVDADDNNFARNYPLSRDLKI